MRGLHECLRRRTTAGIAAVLLAAPGGAALAAESVAPVLWQPSMNVFRRHAVEADAMFAFYGDVLGFEQLGTFAVGNGGVARFKAGASELKLTRRVDDRAYVEGGVRDATGLRLLTFFFPDRAALEARFEDHGLPAPEFLAVPGRDEWRAIVDDPDGQPVELVVVPGADEDVYAQVEVGLTVSDLEQSRAFYGEFVGLEPLGAQPDPWFDTMKHSFRHGSTIVSLRSFDADLPADTGTGGIQYVVSDVDRVDRLAKTRKVSVDQPLSELEGFSLRTIWLDDPDGITNYFAQTSASARDDADRPDFSGLWFPAGFPTRTPDPAPYTEAAERLAEAYEAAFSLNDDPGRYCIWPGMPRAPWGAPFSIEIFQRDQDLTIYWEGYGMYRKVYMADHDPPEALLPSRMGHSIAHWEGDTLVIETGQLRPYPYMNRFATTSNAEVVERMYLEERTVDGEVQKFLIDDIVVTDPQLYTEPVRIHAEAEFRPDLQVLEYTCTDTLWENYLLERGLTLPDIDALPNPADD